MVPLIYNIFSVLWLTPAILLALSGASAWHLARKRLRAIGPAAVESEATPAPTRFVLPSMRPKTPAQQAEDAAQSIAVGAMLTAGGLVMIAAWVIARLCVTV